MSQPVIRCAPSTFAALLVVATALPLGGCGGGGDDVLPLRAAPAAAVPLAAAASSVMASTVQLAGCVFDELNMPRSNSPVRALAADGRLLANAQSDERGAFKLQVPAGQDVSLTVDRPDGGVLKVASGHRSRALTTCLLDPSA